MKRFGGVIRKLGPGDYRDMPWKNRAGSTTELLIEPPAATLAGGFRWRVSRATVAESGRFSRFPGLDRSLLLLSGQGMELDHGDHGRVLLPGPLEPVRFPGEWDTWGRLLNGPCLDFNVMAERSAVRHQVTIMRPGSPTPLPEAATVLVYCAQGGFALTGWAEAVQPGELLRADGAGTSGLLVTALATATALVVVAISPNAGGA